MGDVRSWVRYENCSVKKLLLADLNVTCVVLVGSV